VQAALLVSLYALSSRPGVVSPGAGVTGAGTKRK